MFKVCNEIGMSSKSLALYQQHFEEPDSLDETDILFINTGRQYNDFLLSIFFPNLKVIASNTTGDGHIATEYCREHGIKVITLKDDPILQDISAVAELTICLIIMLTRNVVPAIKSVQNSKWNRYPFGGEKMLRNMRLGVIGGGRIGEHLIQRSWNLFESIRVYEKEICRMIELYEVVSSSDIVTVHIPVDGNEGMFTKGLFNKFKDGAYFINTSRGEIIDEDALLWALESGKLAGAATDVLSGEFEEGFDVTQNKLWQYAQDHDNLIITPHIGGSTEDAWEMTQIRIIEKVCEYLESYQPEKAVNQ